MIRTVRRLAALLLTFALTLTLLPAGLRAEAATGSLIQKGKKLRLLAVGNSFSVDGLEYLYKMAESAGYDVTIGNLYIPSCRLATHWDNLRKGEAKYTYYTFNEEYEGAMQVKENESIEDALRDEEWDIVTLQQSSIFSGRPATYRTYQWSTQVEIPNPEAAEVETALLSAPARGHALHSLSSWTEGDSGEKPEELPDSSAEPENAAPPDSSEEPEGVTSADSSVETEDAAVPEGSQGTEDTASPEVSGTPEDRTESPQEPEDPVEPVPNPEQVPWEAPQNETPNQPPYRSEEDEADLPSGSDDGTFGTQDPVQPTLPAEAETVPPQTAEPEESQQGAVTQEPEQVLPPQMPQESAPQAPEEESPIVQGEGETLRPQAITCETAPSGVSGSFPLQAKAHTDLSYESSDPAVASVDSAGTVTLKGSGTAVITITAAESKEYAAATATVTVTSQRTTYMDLLTEGIRSIYERHHTQTATNRLKFGWHMTWAYVKDPKRITTPSDSFRTYYEKYYKNTQTTMYSAITKTVKDVVTPTGLFSFCVPTGTAIQNLRTSYVGDNLNRDGVHLSLGLGRYAAAMTWAATLGISVSDITYLPPGSNGVNARERAVVRNSVTNAIKTPLSVTKSTYTTAPKLKKAVLKVPVNTATGLKLTWGKVSQAEGYRIYRKAGTGSYALIQTIPKGTVVTYTDTAVKGKTGVLYTYCVKSWYTANYSDKKVYSDASNAARMTRLNPPAKVAVPVNQAGGLKLSWSKVAGASGYRVYRKAGSGKYALVRTIGKGTTLTWTDTAVKGKTGVLYTYYLTAFATDKSTGAKGYSVASARTRQTRLNPPAKVAVPVNQADGLKLSWSKVAGANGYRVYRKAGGGKYALVRTIGKGTTLTWTDTAVKGKTGVLYTYYLTAFATDKSTGAKGYSVASVRTRQTRLNPPAKVAVPVNQAGGLKLSWSKVAGANGYRVYRKAGSGKYALAKTIEKGTTLTWTDTAVKSRSGTTYTYYLTAYATDKSTGAKGYSVASARTRQTRLTAPGKVKAANTAAGIKVTWSKVGAAQSYRVYRWTGKTDHTCLGRVSKDVFAFTDKTVKDRNGGDYTYEVVACSKLGEGVPSAGRKVFRLVPSTMKGAKQSGARKVQVAWARNKAAAGYTLYRSENGGKWNRVKAVTPNSALIYTDKGVKAGSTYSYCLRTYKSSSVSVLSNTVKVKVK